MISIRKFLPVISTLAVFTLLFAVVLTAGDSPAKRAEAFTFVQMCDTQLGMGGYKHDVATFKQAVNQINAMETDFVVICGDLVQTANEQSYKDFNAIRAGFTLPCYCAPGNHDVGNVPSAASLKNYRETVGDDYYAVEHKGYTFLIANSQLWKSDAGEESLKHEEWFQSSLKAAKKKGSPVFVVVHYPLFTKDPAEEENYYNLPLEKRKEILALCEENGVVAFLAGHTHKQISNKYKGILLVNGETTSKNFDKRPMGFRLWNVGDEKGLRHEFVELEGMENIPPQGE